MKSGPVLVKKLCDLLWNFKLTLHGTPYGKEVESLNNR
jgi:hypothetical protein